MPTRKLEDFGGIVIAALLLLVGAVVIRETTTYVDFDSAVFPRTVAIVMVMLCLIYIVLWLMRLVRPADELEGGSWPRRISLVALMLASTFVMPWAGFILSSLATFALLTFLAMYEPWTGKRAIVYALVGLSVVLGFYVLFAELLGVPLPAGDLFAE